jgi:hypothetical protein
VEETAAEAAAEVEAAAEGGEKAEEPLKGLAFEGLTNTSDILPRAELEGGDPAAAIRLRSVEQAYCLAACITFKKVTLRCPSPRPCTPRCVLDANRTVRDSGGDQLT